VMRILIDTHIFLWFINNDPKLSPTAKTLLESDVDLLLSVASLWEIAIKISTGKMTLPKPFEIFIPEQLQQNDITVLSIETEHLTYVTTLPFHHRDPFDRLLIAQSIAEGIPIVSVDAVFDPYKVDSRM
jgi:PIN domain nuclease of toxin-antitoxin system